MDGLTDAGDGKAALVQQRELFDRGGGNSTFDGYALMRVLPAAVERTKGAALGLHPVSQALLQLYLGIGAMTPTIELHRCLRKGEWLTAHGMEGGRLVASQRMQADE